MVDDHLKRYWRASATSIVAAGFAVASASCSFRLTHSGRFLLSQDSSASSIVATPHCGACSFSDDLTSDGISATGCPQRFAHWGTSRFVLRNLSRRSRHHWRFNTLLASIDSLRALPASQDSPLGYRFLRSPPRCASTS